MIWGKLYIDIILLYLPGVLAIILSHTLLNEPSTALLVSLIAVAVLDAGHVYTTIWRTYLQANERSRTYVYLLMPIGFFVLFFSWVHFKWVYLGAFVTYVTAFHNIRQLLGISRWYQKLNKQWSRISDIFLYLSCVFPFLIFHFRSNIPNPQQYVQSELFLYPHPQIHQILLGIYGFLILVWVGFEAYRLFKYKDLTRTLSVFFAGVFYGFALIKGQTLAQILFPLIVSHGVSYLALMDFSMRRINPLIYKGVLPIILLVITTAFFGGFKYWLEKVLLPGQPWQAFFIAVILTPLFCHYAIDGFLWKRTHPDSKKIYT